MSKLKEKVHEFAEIAKSLPDNLQVVCFDLLLRNHLEGPKGSGEQTRPPATEAPADPPGAVPPGAGGGGSKQEDIKDSDIHVKVKKFLGKYGLAVSHLNNLFFKEGAEFKTLYEDLKTTKTSESQIRVTLLHALHRAISTGEFQAEVEAVREECAQRKCYDKGNFAANFKNRKALFDFDNFTKDTTSVRLSEAGRKALSEVIQELQ